MVSRIMFSPSGWIQDSRLHPGDRDQLIYLANEPLQDSHSTYEHTNYIELLTITNNHQLLSIRYLLVSCFCIFFASVQWRIEIDASSICPRMSSAHMDFITKCSTYRWVSTVSDPKCIGFNAFPILSRHWQTERSSRRDFWVGNSRPVFNAFSQKCSAFADLP